ncbi:myeloid leukemia factor isoform X2 [Solenopsis invicta]|uniref:myeloid leukemia factor isoform X2 n=1 Tax=Solenopsis invicta TaxID=13686 RepID=UPI0001FEE092|nr:myeloid leukemia factor isoform X2 [Solenopsis invicta]
MSLFGSFMGDDDIFNIFGSSMHNTMRQMNTMMNSMFTDPFDMMRPNALMPHYGRGLHNDMPVSLFDPHFGRFDFNNMTSNGNMGHSFMSQSVMTMSSGPDGRPQVYQETMSTRTAPGGIKETKQTVSDSRTGTRKMAIGHHIGERAHILERERNLHNGDEEERQEFINLDEEEAESFNREWETRTRRVPAAIDGARSGASNVRVNPERRQLALPSTTDIPASYKSPEPAAASSRTETLPTSSLSTPGSRKREHKPDRQVSNKRHAVPASDN